MQVNGWLRVFLSLAISLVGMSHACPLAYGADQVLEGSATSTETEAEKWVKERSMPSFLAQDQKDKKSAYPLRGLIKKVGTGVKKELAASADGMAKDMVFVFSVTDSDPYQKSSPPKNRSAIVLKMTMIDGSSAYLRRFPDGSFAIEDGYADGTVMVPDGNRQFIVKYPNGVNGKVVVQGSSILIYRPDKTITTFKKTSSGGYTFSNDKLGYMGEARPDRSGVHYEVGEW